MVGCNDDNHLLCSPNVGDIAWTLVPPFHEGDIYLGLGELYGNHRVSANLDVDACPIWVAIRLEIGVEQIDANIAAGTDNKVTLAECVERFGGEAVEISRMIFELPPLHRQSTALGVPFDKTGSHKALKLL